MTKNGLISTKVFAEYLARTAAQSLSLDLLSDDYTSYEIQHFQAIASLMDPSASGFLNWQKFLMLHTQLLPVSHNNIISTRNMLPEIVNRTTWNKSSLWFEQGFQESQGKIKDALFGIYYLKSEIFARINAVTEHSEFDASEFLLTLALDPTPLAGLEKAFLASSSKSSGKCRLDLIERFIFNDLVVTDSSLRFESSEVPDNIQKIRNILASSDHDDGLTFAEFCENAKKMGVEDVIQSITAFKTYNVAAYLKTDASRPSTGLSTTE